MARKNTNAARIADAIRIAAEHGGRIVRVPSAEILLGDYVQFPGWKDGQPLGLCAGIERSVFSDDPDAIPLPPTTRSAVLNGGQLRPRSSMPPPSLCGPASHERLAADPYFIDCLALFILLDLELGAVGSRCFLSSLPFVSS